MDVRKCLSQFTMSIQLTRSPSSSYAYLTMSHKKRIYVHIHYSMLYDMYLCLAQTFLASYLCLFVSLPLSLYLSNIHRSGILIISAAASSICYVCDGSYLYADRPSDVWWVFARCVCVFDWHYVYAGCFKLLSPPTDHNTYETTTLDESCVTLCSHNTDNRERPAIARNRDSRTCWFVYRVWK